MILLFKRESLQFEGNWLLTSPNENQRQPIAIANHNARRFNNNLSSSQQRLVSQPSPQPERNHYGAVTPHRETLGTVNSDNHPVSVVSFTNSLPQSQQRRDFSSRLTNSSRRVTTTHSVRTGVSYHTGPNSSNLVDDQYMSEEERQVDL